jgi:hypothetical protein
MSDLKLTTAVDPENPVLHDLEVRNGQLVWVGLDPYDEDEQAAMIGQRCVCRLELLAGEWYLDQRQGVPWQQVLLRKGTTRARIARVIRAALEAVPGVRYVRSVEVSTNATSRVGTVTFEVVGDANAVIGPVTLDLPFIVRAEV